MLGADDSAESGLHARVRVLLGDVADTALREALSLLSKAGILAGRGYGRNPYHLSPLYDRGRECALICRQFPQIHHQPCPDPLRPRGAATWRAAGVAAAIFC